MDDSIILLFNAGIWLITFAIFIKKNHCFSLGGALLFMYTLMSIVAIPLYYNKLAYMYFERSLNFFPMVYLYMMIMISLYPILRVNQNEIKQISIPNGKIFEYICILFSFISVIYIIRILPSLQQSFILLLVNSDNALDIYNTALDNGRNHTEFSGSYDFIGIFSNLIVGVAPLFFFTYLLRTNRKRFVIIGLSICLMVPILSGIEKASRMLLLVSIMELLFYYILIKDYLEYNINKKIQKFIGIGTVIMLTFFIIISIGRSEGDINQRIFNYQRYFSEGVILFNQYCLDANGTREGELTFPLVKQIIGNKDTPAEYYNRVRQMKINNSRFSTYVGDFVLDFGPFYAFLIFILLFILTYPLLKTKLELKYHQLILLFILLKFTMGFFQYCYTGVPGNVRLFFLIIMYLYYKNCSCSYLIIKKYSTK